MGGSMGNAWGLPPKRSRISISTYARLVWVMAVSEDVSVFLSATRQIKRLILPPADGRMSVGNQIVPNSRGNHQRSVSATLGSRPVQRGPGTAAPRTGGLGIPPAPCQAAGSRLGEWGNMWPWHTFILCSCGRYPVPQRSLGHRRLCWIGSASAFWDRGTPSWSWAPRSHLGKCSLARRLFQRTSRRPWTSFVWRLGRSPFPRMSWRETCTCP